MLLAMHMANELLTPTTAAVLFVPAAIAVVAAGREVRRVQLESAGALTGVMGAFVFAAQMVNFSLPWMPGTSGHLCGGVLLAIVLGPHAALLIMTAILIVQCLVFQDGGLLALGANVLNMGVLPCYLGYGVYRLVLRIRRLPFTSPRWAASFLAGLVGVMAGAAMVPLEAGVSGVLAIPLATFLWVMLGVHVLIGACEGLATALVVGYLQRVHPGLGGACREQPRLRGYRRVPGVVLGVTVVLATVGGLMASAHPDGLEWALYYRNYSGEAKPVQNTSVGMARADQWQARWSLMPDYGGRTARLGGDPRESTYRGDGAKRQARGWGSLAGLVGSAVTLLVVYVLSEVLRRRPAFGPAGGS